MTGEIGQKKDPDFRQGQDIRSGGEESLCLP